MKIFISKIKLKLANEKLLNFISSISETSNALRYLGRLVNQIKMSLIKIEKNNFARNNSSTLALLQIEQYK